MGKKDKKRARAAAAAAATAASQNNTAQRAQAVSRVSQPDQHMTTLPGSGRDHHQGTASPFDSSWPAVNTALATNGLGGGPGYPMPQMMNGLQNFTLPIMQPNFLHNQQSQNAYDMGIGMGIPMAMGNIMFSTMAPNMFPGQPPAPASGQYQLPRRKSQRAAAAAADLAIASEIATGISTDLPVPVRNTSNGRSPITAPSKASGGVPNPTASYLARASFLPQRRAEPGPLLVVIDLNGTILFRPDRRRSHNFLRRPHADTFIRYCVETFWVVFWSSARPENVRRMVELLVSPEQRDRVVAVWGRDRFGLTPEDYNARTQCYKRLTTLWSDPVVKASFPADRPGYEGRCWDQGNTVLIDDSVEKARSEPHNAVTIPEFTGDMNEPPDILPKVHDYLNELCFQEDVSTYARVYPFKMA